MPDLKDPNLVYSDLQGGVVSLTDRRTGASWGINPHPGGIGSSGQWMAPQKYRFNWNTPIVLSPQDLTAEVGKAEAKLNGLITGDIAAINEAMKTLPRIVVEPIR